MLRTQFGTCARRWLLCFCLAATGLSVGFVFTVHHASVASSNGRIRVAPCLDFFAPVWKPAIFSLDDCNGEDQLIHVHWSTWNSLEAIGEGQENYLDCSVSCAASRTWITVSAEVVLAVQLPTQSGKMFEEIKWREVISDSCDTKCKVRWAPWKNGRNSLSAVQHRNLSSCSNAEVGLAADQFPFGSTVWCEHLNGKDLWHKGNKYV
jgi:hypothetical protein